MSRLVSPFSEKARRARSAATARKPPRTKFTTRMSPRSLCLECSEISKGRQSPRCTGVGNETGMTGCWVPNRHRVDATVTTVVVQCSISLFKKWPRRSPDRQTFASMAASRRMPRSQQLELYPSLSPRNSATHTLGPLRSYPPGHLFFFFAKTRHSETLYTQDFDQI